MLPNILEKLTEEVEIAKKKGGILHNFAKGRSISVFEDEVIILDHLEDFEIIIKKVS